MNKRNDDKSDLERFKSEFFTKFSESFPYIPDLVRLSHEIMTKFPESEIIYTPRKMTCAVLRGDFLMNDKFLECSISWVEEKKQYQVIALFQESLEIVQKLIQDVASDSTCSCGQTLVLSDYSMQMIMNDVYRFSGIYKCSKCKEPVPGVLKRIGSFFKALSVQGKVGPVKIGYCGHLINDDIDD